MLLFNFLFLPPIHTLTFRRRRTGSSCSSSSSPASSSPSSPRAPATGARRRAARARGRAAGGALDRPALWRRGRERARQDRRRSVADPATPQRPDRAVAAPPVARRGCRRASCGRSSRGTLYVPGGCRDRRPGGGAVPACPRLPARRCRRPRATAARGARGGGAATQRLDEDGASARGQPRPALAADRDPCRGREPREPVAGTRCGRAHGLLETVRSEAERLDRVVGNLLDLSRLQAGARRPRESCAPSTAWSSRRLPASRATSGWTSRCPTTSRSSRSTTRQIERVLANVLENAIRFSPEASPVSIAASAVDGEVLIRIEDEGPGVPRPSWSTSSSRSGTLDGAATEREPGSGLRSPAASPRPTAAASASRLEPGGGASFVLALPAAAIRAAIPV